MQRLKKLAGVLAMVFVVSFLFSGCADASIAERRQDTSSTLYTGYVGTSFPTSFMPWLSRDGIAPTVASMIYNTLFSYDTDSGTYAPLTAKSWCYVDLEGQPLTQDQTFQTANDNEAVENYYSSRKEDYMAVRIELYDNVYWSDGEKLTVEDVYYSFDLATDYTLSNHAGALAWTADLKHESDGGKLVTQGMFTAKHPDLSGTYGILPGEEDTVMYLLVNKSFGAVTTLFTGARRALREVPRVRAGHKKRPAGAMSVYQSSERSPVTRAAPGPIRVSVVFCERGVARRARTLKSALHDVTPPDLRICSELHIFASVHLTPTAFLCKDMPIYLDV